MKKTLLLSIALGLFLLSCKTTDESITNLRCEYLTNPLSLAVKKPHFSWNLQAQGDNILQEAYQIVVSNNGKEVWNSGKVTSGESVNIKYLGEELKVNESYQWKVTVFDNLGNTYVSPEAFFETGMFSSKDWTAKWIGKKIEILDTLSYKLDEIYWIWYPEINNNDNPPKGDRFFKSTYSIDNIDDIETALFILSGDDTDTLSINGKEIGASGWLKNKQYDVLHALKTGNNLLEVKATNKWGSAGVTGQLFLRTKDGENLYHSTDNSWQSSKDKATWTTVDAYAKSGEGEGLGWLTPEFYIPEKIEQPAYLRKSFETTKTVTKARLHATALGVYDVFINGQKVENNYMAPGWSDYNKRVLYQSYDVTSLLTKGANTVAATLGDGWYTGTIGWGHQRNHYGKYPLWFLAEIHITYSDGSTEVVLTDETWKCSFGPILASDMLDGEVYDFNREINGWNTNAFDDNAWKNVGSKDITENIMADPGPGITIVKELKPKTINKLDDGTYILDMGQNMVGWMKININGSKGDTIKIGHAEMLQDNGTLYTENLRSAKAIDTYILKDGEQTLEPHFTFHGFRYVSVKGCKTEPVLADFTGKVLQSNTPRTGYFECSNPLVNQIYNNAVWGQRGNFISVPTDCPQRDERLGWMGDAQVFVKTAAYNMDVCPFFNKWMYDVVDAQAEDGGFSDVSPRLIDAGNGAPAWGDAGVIVPWTIYNMYGNKDILERHYPAYVAWIEYVKTYNPDLLWVNNRTGNFGDWLNTNAVTDRDVLATAFFAYSTNIVAQIAETLGKTADAEKYNALFSDIANAFATEYVAEDGTIRGNTQTAYVLALKFNLLPEELKAKAVEHLVADIEAHDMHHTTGFVGIGHLLPTLTMYGQNEIAWQLMQNKTFPSLGFMVENGATTIWERWDGYTPENGFQNAGMNSFNHYSLGSPTEWLYTHALGITAAKVGFKHINIQPRPGGGITWAKGSVETIYGNVRCDWKIEGEQMSVTIEIPDNTTATVSLPCMDVASTVNKVSVDSPFSVYEIGSGTYSFTGKYVKID